MDRCGDLAAVQIGVTPGRWAFCAVTDCVGGWLLFTGRGSRLVATLSGELGRKTGKSPF
jgi:hypothetical protein